MIHRLSACLIILTVISPAHARPPRLLVPADLSAPKVKALRINGVQPGARVRIEVTQRRGGTRAFASYATYTADRNGRVDVAMIAPIEGSYSGIEPLGLFWSGSPRPAAAGDPAPDYARIVASVAGREVAVGIAAIRPNAARLVVSDQTPFPGAIWVRPADGHRRHPVVIVLGGSEGGSSTARDIAPMFAARGYATLGLPYYDPGYDPSDRVVGLPRSFTEIPVDRLEQVRKWLARQPEADVRRLGLWGVSKGAEFSLIAASRYPWIRAVVAVVPSDLVWEGWGAAGPKTSSFSFGGRPLEFEPYAEMDEQQAKAAGGERMDIHRVHVAGRAENPGRVAAARIPIERFRGPLLLIAGGVDQIWPSAEMTANIVATRRRQHLVTRTIIEPRGNHFLAGPGTDPVASLASPGTEPAAIAHARTAGWAATFRLFDDSLRP